jgi:putative FmdB family regulatory protein
VPTYRYECGSCRKTLEVFQFLTEPRLRKCPECGGKLERLIGSGAGVLLKGGGFYSTENRSESYRQAAKGESESKPAAPEAGEKKASGDGAEPKKKEKKEKAEKKDAGEKKARSGGKAKE